MHGPAGGAVSYTHLDVYKRQALEFSVPVAQAMALSHVRLRVTWDDRALPSIDAPIALFFGAGILYNRDQREYLVKSLPMVIRYGKDLSLIHI